MTRIVLVIGSVVLILGSCSAPPRAILPPATLSGICEPSIEACSVERAKPICNAALACVDAREQAEVCAVRLQECSQVAGIDRAELEAARQRAEADAQAARESRWWWGAVGVAAGALLAGLLAGLL